MLLEVSVNRWEDKKMLLEGSVNRLEDKKMLLEVSVNRLEDKKMLLEVSVNRLALTYAAKLSTAPPKQVVTRWSLTPITHWEKIGID